MVPFGIAVARKPRRSRTHRMKSLQTRLKRIYSIFLRDIIFLLRISHHRSKALVLDMDWYRFSLSEEEIHNYLYNNKMLKQYINFVRVDRHEIFQGKSSNLHVTKENYREVSSHGMNLWGICKATIASNLGAIKPDLNNKQHLLEVRTIYDQAATGLSNLKSIFQKLKPDGVFVFQGGVFDSRCVVEMARRFSTNVVGIENSMVGGMVILDNLSGQIINRHLMARIGSDLMEILDPTDSQREKTFNIWRDKIVDKAGEHKTGGIDNPEDMRTALGLNHHHKLLLLLGQVRTDASIILDSPIYPDPVDMIEEVSKCVKKLKGVTLLIRLHPKELTGESLNGIPYDRMTYRELVRRGIDQLPNVKIVEDASFNTYTLMDLADAGVTITSQSGLEMCLLGKPVLVCGNAFYGRKGFTLDLGHASALESTLNFLINEAEMTKEQHKHALDFLFLLFERHLFDHQLSMRVDRLLELFAPNLVRGQYHAPKGYC